MTRLAIVVAIFAVLATGQAETVAGDRLSEVCPVEQLVGRVRTIEGDESTVRLLRETKQIPIRPSTCLIYDDTVIAGPLAIVTIDTSLGPRHAGGDWNASWVAPKSRGRILPEASSMLLTLFRGIMNSNRPHRVYVQSLGIESCVHPTGSLTPLTPLAHFDHQTQIVGSDVSSIVAPWSLRDGQRLVGARLLDENNKTVASATGCGARFVSVPLPPNALQAGDRATLEVFDDRGVNLRYDIAFVEPKLLPQPPVTLQRDWLVGAWRVAEGPSEARLDGLSRLMTAPQELLAARWIEEAIFNGEPF